MVNAVPLYFAYAALGWPMLFSEAAAAAGEMSGWMCRRDAMERCG
jgi:hypothetical protein